jgi:CMP-N-acetylneuraminic acid synthetase
VTHTIAVIPARGGSRRLPRKNLAPILGQPLVVWAIRAAGASRAVGRSNVFVSTDDAEIAAVARAEGAGVIERPGALAQDQIWTEPVVQHAVEQIENLQGRSAEVVVWMNACGAEVTAADVDRAVDRLLSESLREVFSVDGQLRSNSIVRALRREALFQRRLSVHCAVMVLDYIDVHYAEDLPRVEARLLQRLAGERAA